MLINKEILMKKIGLLFFFLSQLMLLKITALHWKLNPIGTAGKQLLFKTG